MKVVENKIAQFDNTYIYVHRRSKKLGGEFDGRYIRIGGLFRLGVPDLEPQQYIGLHDSLVLTMKYPEYAKDLLTVAADLPYINGVGILTWLGTASCHVSDRGMNYYVPRRVWGKVEGDYGDIIHTTSYLSVICGSGKGHYYLLSIPLISRKFLRDRYRKISLTPHSQKKKGKDRSKDEEIAPADDKG